MSTRYSNPEQLEIGSKRKGKNVKGMTVKEKIKKIEKLYSNLPKNERRRLDYYRNEVTITCAMNNLIMWNNRFPTVLEIEAETGISRTTIYKHLKEIKGLEYEVEFEQKVKKLRRFAIEQLYSIGVTENNVKAITEFLKWTSKPQDAPINQYLQINNVYIDQRTIQALPEEKRNELESIILNDLKLNKLDKTKT